MAKYEKWLQDVVDGAEEVMKHLGAQDYKESVYEEALCHEMRLRGIPYERQRNFELMYKGYTVGGGTVDFIINPFWATKKKADEHVMEIKAVKGLNKWHERQALVYMISMEIASGAVMTFSPDGEVVVIPQVLPKKKLVRVVQKAKSKKVTVQANTLKKVLTDVHEYFGLEFMYNDAMAKCIYESAIGVELRLAGIHSIESTHPILYKTQKVDSLDLPFVFKDGSVMVFEWYAKEEEIEENVDYYKYYAKKFGLKKVYLGQIPKKEDLEIAFKEI